MSEKMSGSDYSWLQHVAIVDDDGWSIRGTEEQLDEIMRLARLAAQAQPDKNNPLQERLLNDLQQIIGILDNNEPSNPVRFAAIRFHASHALHELKKATEVSRQGGSDDPR